MKQLKLQSVMLFWEVMYLSATAVTLLLAGKSESSEVCFRFVVCLFVFLLVGGNKESTVARHPSLNNTDRRREKYRFLCFGPPK